MNTKRAIVICGVVITTALLVLFWPNKYSDDREPGESGTEAQSVGNKIPQEDKPSPAVSSPGDSSSSRETGKKPILPVKSAGSSNPEGGTQPLNDATAADLREKKLEQWDALVDRIAELDEVPLERGNELKRALNGLDPEDKLPAVNHALNLVSDEGFAAFVPILFDKTQPEEVLDAVFSDALNRDDSIKVPLMKELRKDKTHPMFFESARILDATGEDQ